MRESVLIYRSFVDAIDMLPEAEQLKAYRAITRYGLDGDYPDIDGAAGAVFTLAKPQIDSNNRRYENSKKGGRPKTNQGETEQKPNDNQDETETEAKEKVKVKDKVKDNINPPISPLKETQDAMFNRLVSGRAINKGVHDALADWIAYKAERNERYKEAGMRSLITQAVNHGARYGPGAVIEAINVSMASGYKGIVWDRTKKAGNKFNNAPQRAYDMDELERELLATN